MYTKNIKISNLLHKNVLPSSISFASIAPD